MRGRLGMILVLIALISACQNAGEVDADPGVFRPPTQVVETTPLFLPEQEIAEATPATPSPTVAPACTDSLWFLQDLSIPDGTLVSAGEALDKRWLVQNSGSCNWDERYEVRLVAGPNLGVPVQQALYPALSGVQVTIRMNFIAPDEPGAYRSAWQAFDPNGVPFGDPFFIDIVVVAE